MLNHAIKQFIIIKFTPDFLNTVRFKSNLIQVINGIFFIFVFVVALLIVSE
jgi:hypothetical protein